MFQVRANSSARCRSRLPTATTSTSSDSAAPASNFLLMSAVERIPHFTAIVYPQLVSVMGLNATSRMRWLRGLVSTKSTVSATSSADIIPASSGMSGVRP